MTTATSESVLFVDPGEKVGWARADISPEGEWSDLRHGITALRDMAIKLHEVGPEYDVLGYEAWRLYPAAAKFMIGNDMQPSQFVGMVRLVAWVNNTRLVSQGANVMKTARKTAPEWLQEIIANEPASHDDAHNVDALLHLWHFTWEKYI